MKVGRTRLIAIAGAAAAMLGMQAMMPASDAFGDGTGSPIVVAPADGAVVHNGFVGPFRVDFSQTHAGDWLVTVDCDGYELSSQDYYYDGTNPTLTWTTDPISGRADCNISVDDQVGNYGVDTFTSFTVQDPPIALTAASFSPTAFYPEAYDGYKDHTTFSYDLTQDGTASLALINAAGQTVRNTKTAGYAGTNTWTWNGRNTAGNLVAPGQYTLQLSVKDQWGYVATASKAVTVATGWRTTKHTTTLYGSQGTRSHTRSCTSLVNGTATRLRCLGTGYAAVRYRVTLPAGATFVAGHYSGRSLSGDEPGNGRILATSGWIDSRHLWVQIKVTGWRAISVGQVSTTYSTETRI